ncbi:MAG: ATP-grasp domain-containing protein [Phycisphaerales bacterium]|nr:ATP-grasp domain-containing protein [Phycisphaerales bacterium]MCI0629260.1 ATP-grasp domain-containing protein [Phycisphaerales bacterium]MCI0674454.1 ATP-grasp domain-containing protein [Phycisphaerales bacterium]
MKITVLTHLEKERDEKTYDVVVDQVVAGLRSRGHEASILGVHADVRKLVAGLEERKPDLVFNLMETFGKTQLGAVGVVGLLELVGVPYTGGGPGEYYLQEDKAITKKLLAFERIRFPDFAVFSMNADLETGGNLRLPLFVKPLRMDASIGIDGGKSLVNSTKEMMQQVATIHKMKDSALVEEFIDGREFFVSVLGNQSPQALPAVEIDFSGLPAGVPRVLDAKAKWDINSVQYKGTKSIFPSDLSDEVKAKLEQVALQAYRALQVRDYGRVDLRMAETGEIYVIEVNASCYLERSAEFVMAAEKAGIEYSELLERIAELALERRGKKRGNGARNA